MALLVIGNWHIAFYDISVMTLGAAFTMASLTLIKWIHLGPKTVHECSDWQKSASLPMISSARRDHQRAASTRVISPRQTDRQTKAGEPWNWQRSAPLRSDGGSHPLQSSGRKTWENGSLGPELLFSLAEVPRGCSDCWSLEFVRKWGEKIKKKKKDKYLGASWNCQKGVINPHLHCRECRLVRIHVELDCAQESGAFCWKSTSVCSILLLQPSTLSSSLPLLPKSSFRVPVGTQSLEHHSLIGKCSLLLGSSSSPLRNPSSADASLWDVIERCLWFADLVLWAPETAESMIASLFFPHFSSPSRFWLQPHCNDMQYFPYHQA